MNGDDRHRLILFVSRTPSDIGFVFDVAREHMDAAVAERLFPAWEAATARQELEALEAAIASERFDDQLDRVGLSGPELDDDPSDGR